MDTNPLPSQDSGHSGSDTDTEYDSDQEEIKRWCMRVNCYERFTPDSLYEWIDSHPDVIRYVIGREEPDTIKEHYHIVFDTPDDITDKDVRIIIRSFLDPLWVDMDGKLPIGYGNKQYNLQLNKKPTEAISYACKMKEFKYKGFDDDYIAELAAESFVKNKPSTFKQEYIQLCSVFQSDPSMGIRVFMIEYIKLKAKHGQLVNIQHAYGYALSNLVKREPGSADNLVDNFLGRL